MFYRIKNDKLQDYSDSQYADDCLKTDLCTKAEYQNHPSMFIVGDVEEEFKVFEYEKKTIEVPVIDPETGEPTGETETIEVDDLEKPIMVEETVINPDTGEEETILVHKFHYEIRTYRGLIPNPNGAEEEAVKERQRLDALSLTPADVERALYKAKGMNFEDLKALIAEQIPTIDLIGLAIEFRAKDFYRGATAYGIRLFDVVGQLLGYTTADMDYLFEHKELPNEENN